MIKWIYYTFRNLGYYRKQRSVSSKRLIDITNPSIDTRDSITAAMLATVGLKIVHTDAEMVPWYIPLSKVQRSWISKTSEFGYKVGLE